MNGAARAARTEGCCRLPRRKRSSCFLARYEAIVEDALAANKALLSRGRNPLEREPYDLALALQRRRTEVTHFIVDLSLPLTNNEADRSLRMTRHRKISGCVHSKDHPSRFVTIRSYLAAARKHAVDALWVLSVLFRGEMWMPPLT